MRILFPALEPSPAAILAQRLGRAPYFLVVETDTMEWEAHPNSGERVECGAGVQAAVIALQVEVQVVISFEFGPKAFAGLQSAKIQMALSPPGLTCREAAQAFLAGELRPTLSPTIEGHAKVARRW